jgi:hypothetical protein
MSAYPGMKCPPGSSKLTANPSVDVPLPPVPVSWIGVPAVYGRR